TDRWGSAHYGHLTGLLSAPLTVTMALAPFGATALAAAVGGYATAFLILGGIAAAAALLSTVTIPKPQPRDQHS
ncbi:MFS transporter, partial [Nocardia asiatica]